MTRYHYRDGEVVLLGSIILVPSQRNIHPFGVEGAPLTHFGYAVLANAVGHEPPAVPSGTATQEEAEATGTTESEAETDDGSD